MIRRLLNRFFHSKYWKVLAVITLLVLAFLLLRVFETLRQVQQNFAGSGPRWQQVAQELEQVYAHGVFAAALLTIIVLAGLIDLLNSIRVTRRFRALTEAINFIAVGNLKERVRISSRDEIGRLAATFNQMADTIESSFEKLRETDALRRELVANVAHDLGGPTTAIQGYAETIIMKDAAMPAAERQRYLEIILKNARSLGRMVTELFDLSKFDAAVVRPQYESFSIITLALDVASRFQEQAAQQNITIAVKSSTFMPLLWADINMIERVISNLLENAVRYTPAGGAIMVDFEDCEHEIRVAISDTGVGIAANDLPHIFQRFFRAERERSRSKGGVGLGLAIVKHIIESHSGRVWVSSRPNHGSLFGFSLPKKPVDLGGRICSESGGKTDPGTGTDFCS